MHIVCNPCTIMHLLTLSYYPSAIHDQYMHIYPARLITCAYYILHVLHHQLIANLTSSASYILRVLYPQIIANLTSSASYILHVLYPNPVHLASHL